MGKFASALPCAAARIQSFGPTALSKIEGGGAMTWLRAPSVSKYQSPSMNGCGPTFNTAALVPRCSHKIRHSFQVGHFHWLSCFHEEQGRKRRVGIFRRVRQAAKTTCRSSKGASEWRRTRTELTLNVVVGARRARPAADQLLLSPHPNKVVPKKENM